MLAKAIATMGGIGFFRPAPGTWGSAAALVLAYACWWTLGTFGLLLLTALAMGAGWWATERYLRDTGTHDPSEVVIDEVAGQLLTLVFVALFFVHITLDLFAAAFLLFRLFDIIKFWPADLAERGLPGASGVMVDDLVAAVYAAAGVILIGAVL